jgi:glycosyltransferase involved in cell wall biosynthesis
MKVLIVCSFNAGRVPTFITEQVWSLSKVGINTECFLIKGKGIAGYLKNYRELKKKIRDFKPDLIHAHYGLSALLTVLQRTVPVISTFHGSDINDRKVRLFSIMAMKRSVHSVFVSEKLARLANAGKNYSIIPCGIDLETIYPVDKSEARSLMGFKPEDKIVLFSGSFDNKVKNFSLANQAVQQLNQGIQLIELKGYSRKQVNYLLNASDVALLTSHSEGSPNFIKEAMACNCPIVATDVGDVRSLTEDIQGCFIAENNPIDLADKIKLAFEFKNSVGARQRILDLGLEINETARKILRVYEEVMREHEKREGG